jgi:uncharacterized protein YjbI with pentapeptide repeats
VGISRYEPPGVLISSLGALSSGETMETCRYEDLRNRFRCPEAPSAHSPWCFWHNPEQAKTRRSVEEAVGRKQNLTGAWLEGVDLTGADLQNVCLYGAVLRFARLEKAKLSRADLRYSDMTGSTLDGAELEDTLLEGCRLNGASLKGAILRYANMTVASLEGADLTWSDLLSAHMIRATAPRAILADVTASLASFWRANLAGARLERADLLGANLAGADLSGSTLQEIRFDRTTNFGDVRYDRKTRFRNIDTTAMDPSHFPMLYRDIRDHQYLEDFERSHPRIHQVWKLTSDCGRSFPRWLSVYAAVGLLFGALHALLPGATASSGVGGPLTPFYRSFLHLLTLGGRGAEPASTLGEALQILQSIAAYILFAGLLSLLFNKFSRRS